MACTTCGQQRRGVGTPPARRVRAVAPVERVTVALAAEALPVNVLIPMRLLAYQSGRRLLINLAKVDLPQPVAAWLVGRLPGQVTVLAKEPTLRPDQGSAPPAVAKPAEKVVAKKKKASTK